MVLEIINTLAIVIASVVAICGITAWRKEFQGKRNIELAEEVLVLFYEAKDGINAIRSPFSFEGEGSTRKPQEEETAEQKEARDRAYVVYERFDKWKDIFNEILSKRYQFMARFGTEKAQPFEELKRIVLDIQCAANELADMWCEVSYDEQNKKRLKELKKIFWCQGDNDPIIPRLEKVISDIEAICKPIILDKK